MIVRATRRIPALLATLVLAVALAACSTDDDEGDSPTTTAATSPTQAASQPTATAAITQAPPTLSAANGTLISDGVCEALIPEGWVDDGTGQGTTTGGHSFTLFGGRVRSDAEWETSVNLVATPGAGLAVESIDETADSIYVVYAEDRGFEFRKRFGDRYCDFRVSSRSGAIAEDEQGYWDAVTQSLAPVQQ